MSIFKVNTSKQNINVLTIPENCATLVSYDELTYQYELNIIADPLMAVKSGALLIDISLLNQNTINQRSFNYFRNRTPEEIVNNLRKISGLIKDDCSSIQDNPSLKIGIPNILNIDISSYISNNEISQLRRGILPLRTIKTFKTKSVATLNAKKINAPVTAINNNNSALANGYGTTTIVASNVKQQMKELLYEGKIDPGSIWQATNTYVSPQKTTAGNISKKPYSTRKDVEYDSRILNIIANQTTIGSLPQQQKQLSPSDHITILENVPLTQINISKTINVPRSAVGKNNFTLRFKVKNAAGKIYQIVEYSVSHGVNIGNFVPMIPPDIKVAAVAKINKVTFNIQQNDPYASGIYVYRREINPNNPLLNSQYDLITSIPITNQGLGNSKSIIYTDRTATSINNYIYRFVPYNYDEVKSPVYSGVAVKMNRSSVVENEAYMRLPNHGTLDYSITSNSIKVSAQQIPDNVVQINLYKRNLTKNEKSYSLYGTRNTNGALGGNSYSFNDTFIKIYNTYEYKLELIYRMGNVVAVPNTIVVEYVPLQANSAICQIKNFQSTTQSGIVDVSFNVEYQIQEKNFELFRKLLKEQNLLAEYQDEITLNREKIQTFLSYAVTRINLTTGELENFGIISSTNFSDRTFGPPKGVKPLNPDNKYRYTVVVYTRSPDTLFENLERTVNYNVGGTQATTTVTYKFNPYKWLQPLVFKTGNIISPDKHSQIDLAQGYVVDRKEVDAFFNPAPYPQVDNVIATQIQPRSILIEWSINGNLNKIDHFIIKNEVSGIKNVIGAAHNLSNNGAYKYMYNLLSQESGTVTFSIIPVYYDYTFGTESTTNTLVI